MSITLRDRRAFVYAPVASSYVEGFAFREYEVYTSDDDDGAWWVSWHELDPFSLSAGLQQEPGQRAKGNFASEVPIAEHWLVRDLTTGKLFRVEGMNLLERADTKIVSAEWREDAEYTITTDAPSYTVAEVIVTPNPAEIQVGGEFAERFTATARNAFGAEIPGGTPTWRSSDPTVLYVVATGQAEGLQPGVAEIRATLSGVTGAATVTVVP